MVPYIYVYACIVLGFESCDVLIEIRNDFGKYSFFQENRSTAAVSLEHISFLVGRHVGRQATETDSLLLEKSVLVGVGQLLLGNDDGLSLDCLGKKTSSLLIGVIPPWILFDL